MTWDPSPSTDLYQYNVYLASNLATPVASTTATSYVASGLNAGTAYSYIVRAVDISGNEEKNNVQMSATTLSFAVPDFLGVAHVAPVGGVAGLTQLNLTWQVAGGNVTGYRVYMATSAGGEDFASPVAVTGANTSNGALGAYVVGQTTTSATVTNLNPGTKYYFVVRAFYLDNSNNVFAETNQVEKAVATNTVRAPTFAGVSTAAPGSGNLGLTTVDLTWPDPGTDGVYDSFVVDYEQGTCAAGFSNAPQSDTVSDASARSYTVTGLTGQTNYRFRVRSRYALNETIDTNSSCRDANTTPQAPAFTGVSSVATASGIQGFTTLNVTWPRAQGSFTYYLVEWSTLANFSTIAGSLSQISLATTTSGTISGLSAKSTYYVRVTAVFSQGNLTLTSGSTKVLAGSTTPIAPQGEGVSAVQIASATELDVTWTAPTNSGAVFSGYKLWRSCGASAATSISTATSGAPYRTFPTSTLSYNDTNLTSNTQCCYQVRAYRSEEHTSELQSH